MASVTGTKGFPQRTNTIDEEFRKVDERSFTLIVEVDPDTEGVDDALNLAPPVGSGFIGLPQIWLGRRMPRQISRRLIEIDLEFVQRPPGTPPDQEATPNPVDWAPKWLGSSVEKMQRYLYRDDTGKAVVLSNGEMYSTPLFETVNVLVARWRRYYPIVQPALDEYLLQWNNTISSTTFRGKAPFTWLLNVNASPTQVNNFEVAELTFEFRYNKLGWIEERLQVGSFYIDELDGNKPKPFLDSQLNPTTGFLKLNGNPFRQTTPVSPPGGGPPTYPPIVGVLPSGMNPTYIKYRGSYEEKDFNDLLT